MYWKFEGTHTSVAAAVALKSSIMNSGNWYQIAGSGLLIGEVIKTVGFEWSTTVKLTESVAIALSSSTTVTETTWSPIPNEAALALMLGPVPMSALPKYHKMLLTLPSTSFALTLKFMISQSSTKLLRFAGRVICAVGGRLGTVVMLRFISS